MIAFWFLFRKECHRFFKVLVQTVVTPLVSSSLYLLVFGVSLGNQIDVSGAKYLAFLIPGLMMMGLMNNAFQNSASSLVSSKFTGDIEDLAVLPLSHQQIMWAYSLASVVRGAMVALLTLLVGEVFYFVQYHEFLSIAHPFWLLYFIFFAGLVFGHIGLMAAFWANTFDQLSAISAFIILPLTYLGGVFVSITHLPQFWQMLSKINPLFYFINGLRFSVLGVSDIEVGMASFLVFAAWVALYAFALKVLKNASFSRW